MTQTQLLTTALPTSCSGCPQFNDYQDSRSRGWCSLFNSVSFKHHPFTRDCQLNFPDEEDILRSEHEVGSLVKLIDSALDHTQWSTFIVVGKKYNPNRYRNTETFLNQTDWYYRLATTEQALLSQIWVAEDEICHYDQSHIINPQGEF
ncbi:hypothetical protein H1P_5510004 [Hyella patelloides LEGE 07179]|uniref:Uncharacterized protein n=1 Tax=Hyella patelloides LEGE 07179 TaxID=945734 RepID=A0A563W097_9CYAN|nr:hypothetical protein [Hyella patelloides]VEP17124.1 hypothetical protein H1P_5510004 [Hyella patelloides LEGE 07179]